MYVLPNMASYGYWHELANICTDEVVIIFLVILGGSGRLLIIAGLPNPKQWL